MSLTAKILKKMDAEEPLFLLEVASGTLFGCFAILLVLWTLDVSLFSNQSYYLFFFLLAAIVCRIVFRKGLRRMSREKKKGHLHDFCPSMFLIFAPEPFGENIQEDINRGWELWSLAFVTMFLASNIAVVAISPTEILEILTISCVLMTVAAYMAIFDLFF